MSKSIFIFVVVFTMVVAPKIIGAINATQKYQSQNAIQVVAFNDEKGVVKW